MRIVPCLFIVLGLWLLATAVRDQYRGVTEDLSFTGIDEAPVGASGPPILRSSDPELFRHAMEFNWFLACFLVLAGVFMYRLVRREDHLDPSSPDFGAKDQDSE